jgi:hypothetical protein
MRWGAKSFWYEYNYGMSLLRPLLRIQALINEFENDMAVIVHVYAKPMLIVQCGTPDKPLDDYQIGQVMDVFASRDVATDVFVRGDIKVTPMTSLTKDINLDFWLNYLYIQREAVLGVPKIFLGESEGTNRATSDTVLQEFVCRLRMLENLQGEMLETDIFKQLIDAKFGSGTEIPHVKWNPIWEPPLDVKANYLAIMVKEGVIYRSEARLQLGFPAQPDNSVIIAEKSLPQLPQAGGAGGYPLLPLKSEANGDGNGFEENGGNGEKASLKKSRTVRWSNFT